MNKAVISCSKELLSERLQSWREVANPIRGAHANKCKFKSRSGYEIFRFANDHFCLPRSIAQFARARTGQVPRIASPYSCCISFHRYRFELLAHAKDERNGRNANAR